MLLEPFHRFFRVLEFFLMTSTTGTLYELIWLVFVVAVALLKSLQRVCERDGEVTLVEVTDPDDLLLCPCRREARRAVSRPMKPSSIRAWVWLRRLLWMPAMTTISR